MLTLTRNYQPSWTEGIIILPDDTTILTLEKPWRNNRKNRSCIPEGIYTIERNTTGKHQFYGVTNVPSRTFIEIHPANKQDQLAGCIAPCIALENGFAYRSTEACNVLLDWFGDHSWVLEITS